jgi:hypothetical protein
MTRSGHAPRLPTTLLARADEVIKMSQGTAGVPEGVLLESNGISRDLTLSAQAITSRPIIRSTPGKGVGGRFHASSALRASAGPCFCYPLALFRMLHAKSASSRDRL